MYLSIHHSAVSSLAVINLYVKRASFALYQAGVVAVFGRELFMRASLYDLSLIQDNDLIAVADGGKTVGDSWDRARAISSL